MPRVNVEAVSPSLDGTAYTLTAANADGDAIMPGSVLHVVNGSAAPITVTVVTGGTAQGYAIADHPVVIPAGGGRLIGPIPGGDIWPQTSGATRGRIHVDYSAVASVTRGVIGR